MSTGLTPAQEQPMTPERLAQIREWLDAAAHEFLPVNGHPDDDECTYRTDGTDDTYCGEPGAAHDVIPDESNLVLTDLLAEVERLWARLTVDDDMVERAARVLNEEDDSPGALPWNSESEAMRRSYRRMARSALHAALGTGEEE